MNKKLNNGLAVILQNKKIELFVIFIIILGIISGSIFLIASNKTDKELIINNMTCFVNNINTNNINNLMAFRNAFIQNGLLVLIIGIMAMSIIGLLANIFFIFLKSFTIGFSISSFILAFKYKGILGSLIYVFPTIIINIIVMLLLGVYSVEFTINLIKLIFMKDHSFSMKRFLKKYLLILLICSFLIVLSSLSEAYLLPSIMKLVIKLFI